MFKDATSFAQNISNWNILNKAPGMCQDMFVGATSMTDNLKPQFPAAN